MNKINFVDLSVVGIIALLLFIIFLLLLRNVVLWYFKIDEQIELMKKHHAYLRRVFEKRITTDSKKEFPIKSSDNDF